MCMSFFSIYTCMTSEDEWAWARGTKDQSLRDGKVFFGLLFGFLFLFFPFAGEGETVFGRAAPR